MTVLHPDILYPGRVFDVDFRNVNVKARSTKDGMIYKFEAEIVEEDFDLLRSGNLTGSVFNANLECVEVGTPEAPAKPKGGSLAVSAGRICNEPMFHTFVREKLRSEGVVWPIEMTNEEICKSAIYRWCNIKSRAELDHNPAAAAAFRLLMKEYAKNCEHMVVA